MGFTANVHGCDNIVFMTHSYQYTNTEELQLLVSG